MITKTQKKKKFRAKPFAKWLDALCKAVVKWRDGNKCMIAQKCHGEVVTDPYNRQWVHIYTRNARYVRWDLANAVCGCGACHDWAHRNQAEFIEWFKGKYPERYEHLNSPDDYDELMRRHIVLGTWRQDDYEYFELILLFKARSSKMPPSAVPKAYRRRYEIKMKGIV